MIINISDLLDERLAMYNTLSETKLKTIYEPGPGIFIAESPNVVYRAIDAGFTPVSFLVSNKQIDTVPTKYLTQENDIPVFVCEESILQNICGYPMTRGLLCALQRKVPTDYTKLCNNLNRIVILENVMNPTNVGAIFRSAAALSMDAVLLTKGCSDPLYRRASRVSMGTVFQIPYTYIENKNLTWPHEGILELKKMGYTVAAMALSDNCISINDLRLMQIEKLAIIMGTEGDGLSEETLKLCDYIVKIPMSHGVDSLNVAAASAVAFYAITS